ncbi:MAG: SH3 domain-containing protein [Chloroflexi bacterium]|nr:SH3 domain-containing protein [Chloroflexota bacterium]
MSALGLSGIPFSGLSLGMSAATATGVVGAAMAFGLFGKRRRAGDPPGPDEELAAAAAMGLGARPLPAPVPAFEEAADPEAQLPRWRRPSLLLARKADPIRDATPAARLTFDDGLVGPLDGRERRMIRYRIVRMLDTPDELRGIETGYLDRGDEVQLIEKYGAYWLVLCPDGRQGWVHNMTLGEIVDDDAPIDDRPVATMPLAAETWTMGESDDDTDVLEAYLESRRRQS